MSSSSKEAEYGVFVIKQVETITEVLTKVMFGDFTQVVRTSKPDETFGYLCVMINVVINAARNAQDELLSQKAYVDNILKSMIDTLIVVDPDAKMKTINVATAELLGYREEELIGEPVEMIFGEGETSLFKGTGLQKLREAGSVRDFEMSYRTKSGEKIPVSFSGSVMRAKEGTIVGIVGIARDMRELRRLMEKEKELAIQAATAGAERMRANELNEAYAELTEKTVRLERFQKVTVGRELEMVRLKDEINKLLGRLEQSKKYETPDKVQKEKGFAAKAATGSAERMGPDEHLKVQDASLNIMEDLERQRKEVEEREKQLKETQAMLIQAGKMAAMGQLGAGIAHELNQPLAAIRGYAQVIMEEMSSGEPHRKDLEMINEQTERMAQIIDNVRIFSRASEIHLVPLDIHKPIKDALMLLTARLRNHNIEVVREFRKDLPKVVADSNQLQQVFINLIMNARDVLVPRGGGRIWVKTERQSPALTGRPPDLRSDRIGDGPGGRGRGQAAEKVIVRFRDSGPGIPSNIVEQIFDPFFTTKDAGHGTGLGLSISYGIIKDHKGEIEVVSQEGYGAEFVITLPAAQGESSGSTAQKDA